MTSDRCSEGLAPFHPIEFTSVFDRETGNAEPGSDCEKILVRAHTHKFDLLPEELPPTSCITPCTLSIERSYTNANTTNIKNV